MRTESVALQSGAAATLRRTFSQSDFDRFAALSGDDNPIHVDPAFAARTRFGRTVCHGMLLYSTLGGALAQMLGDGCTPLAQELMFVSPTYVGEEVAVRLEVAQVEAGVVTLDTTITRPNGEIACQGSARMALPGAAIPAAPASAAASPAESAPAHKGLALGQSAAITRTFSAADLVEHRDLAGDANPAYSSIDYAQTQGWPAPRIPGALLGGLFSYLLGTRLPGRGANWLKQSLAFPAPAFAGQAITAQVTITRLRPEKDLVNLRGLCTAAGQTVCTGESLVLVKDLEQG